ncbi:MAG: DUF438 domain-containing protein [Candidatus Krumholzibacteriia bacterium]
MSELIGDRQQRMDLLKHLILELHRGQAPDAVRPRLVQLLGKVPYDEVVQVEQQLIDEGLPHEDVLRLCDLHKQALDGVIDLAVAPAAPPGHPAHTFAQENHALAWELKELAQAFRQVETLAADADPADALASIRLRFNNLMDVEKHYLRKENLLFPCLEKRGITGPPTVMWGKHDETRALLATAQAALAEVAAAPTLDDLRDLLEPVLRPAAAAVDGMIVKETEILLPMCLDTLDAADWAAIMQGTEDYGYCLYAPEVAWWPEGMERAPVSVHADGVVRLSTGVFNVAQLEAVLGTIPFDITFVDHDDKVRFFSHGRERIFARSKAILGRDVKHCHPPKSVDTVQRILADFRAGRQEHARFWIQMDGKFISIEYFALRGPDRAYLGTLEVSQDLTAKRALTGQQRLLAYDAPEGASS